MACSLIFPEFVRTHRRGAVNSDANKAIDIGPGGILSSTIITVDAINTNENTEGQIT